jgi:hypothetical protein
MGLLSQTQQAYYQGDEFGDYQFISLNDIINQFIIAYVGEDKIISKIKRTDVAFHAQRALQELSFDTFKSCKAQEIVLPPSLSMTLPQDYVNYINLSWSDLSGIQHTIYPTSKTSNPFKIAQDNDGSYSFPDGVELAVNGSFTTAFGTPWNVTSTPPLSQGGITHTFLDNINTSTKVSFSSYVDTNFSTFSGRAYAIWQPIDVSQFQTVTIKAKGTSAAASGTVPAGVLRFGLSTTPGDTATSTVSGTPTTNTTPPDIAYVEWNAGAGVGNFQTLEDIDVSSYTTIYILVTSHTDFSDNTVYQSTNVIDNISIMSSGLINSLQTSSDGLSTTWSNYSSSTPSEIEEDYQDDAGSRYGLDPQHANVNGSFYVDCRLGKINFSSNLAGKTIVLKYLSDSLGTDAEMKVHKFAEEAMYKWLAHAILATRANTPEYQVMRFKKERFAEVRKAKLRLSNIKLEEITQIMRGKSKQIKH